MHVPEERRGGKKRKGESTMGKKMSRWSEEVQQIGKITQVGESGWGGQKV